LLDGEAWTLKDLGKAQVEIGDRTEARASLSAAVSIFEQIGDQAGAAETASLLASLDLRQRFVSPRDIVGISSLKS
jgi:hypothetical protein